MTDTILAERRAAWPLPDSHRRYWVGDTDRRRIEVRAHGQLVHRQGNERPYFSLTGEVVASPGTSRETWLGGGAIGDTVIVKQRAAWAVVERVHLADDHGWPMHAVENALHWAGLTGRTEGGRAAGACHCCGQYRPAVEGTWTAWEPWEDDEHHIDRLARHLRCTPEQAVEIRRYVAAPDAGSPREAMRFCIRDLEAGWQAEADAALAFLREEA